MRSVTINAIDGIGRLQDIEFDYTATNQETMLKWIYEILEYNDLSQYWGSGVAYFNESCEIYDTQMTNTGTQYSPFLMTRCDRVLFLTDEVSGEKTVTRTHAGGSTSITLPTYRPYTCADILDAILKLFCCRMFISNGVYYIQQVRNFAASTYNERSIRKDLAVISYQTVSPRLTDGTDVDRLARGRWAYLPPLQEVMVNSVPKARMADSGHDIEILEDGSNVNTTTSLGTLKGGSGSGLSFLIRVTVEYVKISNLGATVDVEMSFDGNTYFLKSEYNKPDVIEWTTTGTDTVDRVIDYTDFAGNNGFAYIDILTTEFPGSNETGCQILMEYVANSFSSGDSIKIHPLQVFILKDGKLIVEAQYKVESSASPKTKNSKRVDYGTLILNDITDGLTSKNVFEVNSTGSTWVFSDVWDAGYTTDVELTKTLCLETMSLQDQAVPLLQATLKVPVSMVSGTPHTPMFHQCYYYDSNTWVFNGGTLDCNSDEFNGEFFQFIQGKSGLSVTSEDGDGFVYKGNEKFGTPKKNTQGKDKWNQEYIFVSSKLASISTDTSSGAITSISVTATTKAIKDDDQIAILHPVNLRTVATLVVNGDHASGVTTINVDSITPSELLYEGYFVAQRPDQIFETDKLRSLGEMIGDTVSTTSTTVPTSGGFGLAGAIRNPADGSIYYSDGSATYKLTGTLVT